MKRQWKSIKRAYPRHKQANGKAHKGQRLRHRGVMYRIVGRAVYRESDGRYIGYRWGLFGDPRKSLDKLLKDGRNRRPHKMPKMRQHGRIIGRHEVENQIDLDKFI